MSEQKRTLTTRSGMTHLPRDRIISIEHHDGGL
jgi:hypothetical protein